jgi:hypothetical protein
MAIYCDKHKWSGGLVEDCPHCVDDRAAAWVERCTQHTGTQHGQPVMPGICPLCVNYLRECTRPGVEYCYDFRQAQQA